MSIDNTPSPSVHPARRYAWLGAALLLQGLAVGGRWDLALAAWVFPVLLLRFARTSRLLPALLGVWLVSASGAVFWFLQLAVPFTAITFTGAVALGSVVSLAFAVDRLIAGNLPAAGRILAFPVALVSAEFVLGVYGPFGTAYGLSAVTQHAQLGLLQSVSVAGPYVISFLIGIVASAVNHWWEHGLTRRAIVVPVAAIGVVAAVVTLGQARAAWFRPDTSHTVRIAGVNPHQDSVEALTESVDVEVSDIAGISQADRGVLRAGYDTIDAQLMRDTEDAARAGAELVVWSENAARVLAEDEAAFLRSLRQLARDHGIYLNAAMNVTLDEAPYGKDQTVLVDPDGDVLWTYEKRRPIPGLEPYEPGTGPIPVVETPFGSIANAICYDADFPALMHVDADIMLVPGGDWPEMGWIHTRMSSLRAIENGYALVRQDFNGSSQAFDRHGNLLGMQDTTADRPGTWFVDVPVDGGRATPYRVAGDVFAWLAAGATLGLVATALIRRRRTVTR